MNPYPNVTVGYEYNVYYSKGSSGQTIPGFTDVMYADDHGTDDGDETLQGRTCSPSYNCRTNDADGTIPAIHYNGTLKYDVYYLLLLQMQLLLRNPLLYFSSIPADFQIARIKTCLALYTCANNLPCADLWFST